MAEIFARMAKDKLHPIDLYVIDKVREMRNEREISQVKLAYLLDVSPGFIGDVESNKRVTKYSLKQINQLAEIFECSPKDFLPEKPIR